MKAAFLSTPGAIADRRLIVSELPKPQASAGNALLRVRA